MRDGKKKSLLFIDAVAEGTARLLPEDGPAFEFPAALLPAGAREGCQVEITAVLRCENNCREEIDSLLDELGDDP